MCERFAFYIMMAILVLFLSAKFGLTGGQAGIIYSVFYFSIFVLTIVGGVIADKIRNHRGTVFVGLISMAAGYFIIAIPTPVSVSSGLFLTLICLGLFVIAFGNGLFKGNLQAMIGQMYDDPKYSKMRDEGFSLSYIFLNISVLLAPLVVYAVNYLELGFHYAFAISVFAMAISLSIYWLNEKKLPTPKTMEVYAIKMDIKEVRQRLYVLLFVFLVLNLFYFAFYQNGLTLTLFARDYANLNDIGLDTRALQSINPLFVILLMPILLLIFSILRKRDKEPSTTKKMAIGMGIAAVAFVVMALGSIGLPDFKTVMHQGCLSDAERVTPFLLIGTYFTLTLAGLFLAPLGISFVSKVSPPKYQGLMQSLWMGGASIGNSLLFLGMMLYEQIPIWTMWTVFATVCLLSMIIMLLMMKWVEKHGLKK